MWEGNIIQEVYVSIPQQAGPDILLSSFIIFIIFIKFYIDDIIIIMTIVINFYSMILYSALQ